MTLTNGFGFFSDVLSFVTRTGTYGGRRRLGVSVVFMALLLLGTGGVTPAQAQQEVPDEVRQELQSQGMTPAEARRRAQQLGIDLSNPERAVQQARQRGIPEARIQALVQAARQSQESQGNTTGMGAQSVSPSEVAGEGAAPVGTDTTAAGVRPDTSVQTDTTQGNQQAAQKEELGYFGYETFQTVPDAFKPASTGPVDNSYVVGPQDELRLTVWGGAEFTYDLQVDREGRVMVPNVGQFTAAGKKLGTLRAEMKQWLSRSYSGLTSDPPTVFMDLSVTRLRPLKVYVLGSVAQPGGYTVSATSNAFNALYSVGGPLEQGSLRKIRVFRDGDLVDTVDFYNYLVEGENFDPVGLQSGDFIRVPARGKTVAITGAVQRPAYYEVTEGETVRDLIKYAGGLSSDAYTTTFRISRLIPPGQRDGENASVPRRNLNFDLGAVIAGEKTVELADADRIHIQRIPDRTAPASASNIESARISGAVFQPGEYTIGDSVRTVQDLIQKANGLTDDAYRRQASLIRFDDDLGEAVRTLNVDSVLAGVPRADIPLVPGDSLHISSVQNLEGQRTVQITGQVRNPGTFPYRTDMTVADLLLRGGGLADSTYLRDVLLSRADLFREAQDGRSERVIPFNLSRALNGSGMADAPLRPGDEIRIYPLRAEVNQDKFVEISGAVKNAGEYRYQENMSLEDLILRANGFKESVYLEEIEVARPRDGAPGMKTLRVPLLESVNQAENVRFGTSDTTRALKAASNFRLQHRDRVLVRTDPSYSERVFVTVRGEVAFPGEYALKKEGETLSSVLKRAGGIQPRGYAGGGQLFRNGERFLLDFRRVLRGADDVGLEQGDRITVPAQPNSVSVRGNVVEEGLIKYEEGQGVDYYLDQAGGVRDSTKNIFLTQATGATIKVTDGWFSRSPEVEDGAVIRVTKEPPRKEDIDYAEIASNVTQIVSSTLTVLVLVTRVFN